MLDDVAYVRFASVYRTFKDVQEFVEKLEGDELIDIIDSSSPQLSLTAVPQNNGLQNTARKVEENNETPVPRDRPTDTFSN